MRLPARTFITALFVLLGMCWAASSLEAVEGRVRGVVSDESGGVLPGVTIVAASTDGRVLATTVTDGVGGYVFGALPVGQVSLTFELEGFSPAVVQLAVEAGDQLVSQRLVLPPRAETVVVHGAAPADPLEPPPPVTIPVPEHDRDSICGPAKSGATTESFGTIVSRRAAADSGLYTKGDQLIIDGGTLNGLEVGRNFAVRRTYRVSSWDPRAATGEHTAGLLQIVAATERASVAVVIYACDEFRRGDRLASFTPEPIRPPEPLGIPAYDDAARILFADAAQMLGMSKRLMVIDRGGTSGVRVGQRLTLFRRRDDGAMPFLVGDAVVVAVRTDSATIRVDRATDVISFGDWAAPQRYSPAAVATASSLLRRP